MAEIVVKITLTPSRTFLKESGFLKSPFTSWTPSDSNLAVFYESEVSLIIALTG
jgi:hypothetical protein